MDEDRKRKEPLLTRRELADFLKIGPETLRDLLAAGIVPPGIPVGARLRWDRAEVVAHLRSRVAKQQRNPVAA